MSQSDGCSEVSSNNFEEIAKEVRKLDEDRHQMTSNKSQQEDHATHSPMEVTGDGCSEEHSTETRNVLKGSNISILVLGSGDSLKEALITCIIGKDLSAMSKRETEKLKIYKDDTYKFTCTLSNNTACENIKEEVDKNHDMCVLVVEDGVSAQKLKQQIEQLEEKTVTRKDELRVVQPLGSDHTDFHQVPSKRYSFEEIAKEVRKLDEDRHQMTSNKSQQEDHATHSPMEVTGDGCSEEHSTETRNVSKGNHSDNKVNLVLLGMSGTGKSASGNTILGQNGFMSRPSSIPVTTEFQEAETEINGTRVHVIDTPDMFDDDIETSVKKQHVTQCRRLCQSDPCVYLLVMQVGRFTDDERDILRKVEEAFGSRAKEQTIILFTRGEDLQRAKMSLEDFLQKCQPELKNIVKQCGRRCVVFENKASRQHQVAELMQKVSEMLNKQQKQ